MLCWFAVSFETLVYCDQTAGRIEMKLDKNIRLGLGHIVLDVNPAPLPPKGQGTAPNSRSMCIVAKRLDGSKCYLV